MEFNPDFKDHNTQRIYNNYLKEVDQRLRDLPREEREDVKNELASHLYESFQHEQAPAEHEKMLNAIDRLGDLEAALADLDRSIALDPDHAAALTGDGC